MNIQDFKNKTVSVLNKNFEKKGSISSVFVYVTPTMEFKSAGMDKFADNSKEYVALFLKEITRNEDALFTAYITNTTMTQMTAKDMAGYIAMGDAYVPEDKPTKVEVVSVEINSSDERINLTFKKVGNKLQLVNEVVNSDVEQIANLI